MRIAEVVPKADYTLKVRLEDGREGIFDVGPYLRYEAFLELRTDENFARLTNGGYFIEWDCGADLSADTIETHLKTIH